LRYRLYCWTIISNAEELQVGNPLFRPKTLINTLLAVLVLFSGQVQSGDRDKLLGAARETINAARYAALISIDETGQPRSRTVDAFPPDENFVVWIATRPVTRKVKQIRNNAKVTLYYWHSESRSYVSIMGVATIVDDVAVKNRMRREADSDKLYPNFPADYLLIKIQPKALEGVLPGYRGDSITWAPARAVF